ncbi:MAG: translation elongation factor Ts [Oscillospiraceae bacterium]|nr:translation elongation factor Ts [Oscillospiraceae bacterium]
MAFTAKDVAELRAKTGVGMMDCKKALVEAEGNMDRAVDILRERGLAAATKKAGRVTAEGAVLAYSENGVNVMVEVNSETDFVGKNPDFISFVQGVAKTIALQNPADVEALSALQIADGDVTVEAARQEKILTIGENLTIRRFVRLENPAVASYVHGGGSIGVLAVFNADAAVAAKPEFAAMGRDVAMQVAAMSPQYLCKDSVPADVVEKEKAICKAQLAEDPKMANKPEKVLENIVVGRVNKFYKEVCLLEQQFVKDGDNSVGQYVANVAKELGADFACVDFLRFTKGEGVEKREDDFAAEVAAMTK